MTAGCVMLCHGSEPRSALPSAAMALLAPSRAAPSARSCPKAASSALGPIMRNAAGKVPCGGTAWRSFGTPLKTGCFAWPKAAGPAQDVAPQSTETKAMTSSAPRSWRAMSARGSGTSSKAERNQCMAAADSGGWCPPSRLHPRRRGKAGRSGSQSQMRFSCAATGGGRGRAMDGLRSDGRAPGQNRRPVPAARTAATGARAAEGEPAPAALRRPGLPGRAPRRSPVAVAADSGHGRTEPRRAMVVKARGLAERHDVPGLKAFGQIEATRAADGRTTSETWISALSWLPATEVLTDPLRAYWAIEMRCTGSSACPSGRTQTATARVTARPTLPSCAAARWTCAEGHLEGIALRQAEAGSLGRRIPLLTSPAFRKVTGCAAPSAIALRRGRAGRPARCPPTGSEGGHGLRKAAAAHPGSGPGRPLPEAAAQPGSQHPRATEFTLRALSGRSPFRNQLLGSAQSRHLREQNFTLRADLDVGRSILTVTTWAAGTSDEHPFSFCRSGSPRPHPAYGSLFAKIRTNSISARRAEMHD